MSVIRLLRAFLLQLQLFPLRLSSFDVFERRTSLPGNFAESFRNTHSQTLFQVLELLSTDAERNVFSSLCDRSTGFRKMNGKSVICSGSVVYFNLRNFRIGNTLNINQLIWIQGKFLKFWMQEVFWIQRSNCKGLKL